jgi:DNA-binding PadR family transcriptional regulator
MISKDLVAASSRPIVLSILSRGENYGYEIIRQVRELSNDSLNWTDGMLYPVLHKLEKQGLIESNWRTTDSGRKRKYYSLKSEGKKVLNTEQNNWKTVNSVLNRLWEESPCLA